MSARTSTDRLLGDAESVEEYTRFSDIEVNTPDTGLGDVKRRSQVEKRLLHKLDLRISLLVLLILMNSVGYVIWFLVVPFSGF